MDLLIGIIKMIEMFIRLLINFWYCWVWIIPLFILKIWLNSPKRKGKRGEKAVKKSLDNLPEDQYQILNNILLDSDNGTSQIDHIVISVYGIFVIETKNYTGVIYGSEHSSKWTQYINGNKYSFQNPIHQNYGHIKTVESFLSEFADITINSIIVFAGNCKLKIKTETPVVYEDKLYQLLQSLSKEVVLTSADIIKIKDILSEKNITDYEQKKAHNKYVSKIKTESPNDR